MEITTREAIVAKRFHAKYIPVTESGCWLWTAAIDRDGYGQFHGYQSSMSKAHRFAYELLIGPIQEGMTIDHLCKVRCCVNPSHMEVVDNKTNVLRGSGFAALNSRKTHCNYGHAYDDENTLRVPFGRACKKCQSRRNRIKV